ncbi:MAG TPA: HNH endonuclease [Phycisphaerae bacterium]|nr:HNH endonuclease [Phycisphaerae bacterium]
MASVWVAQGGFPPQAPTDPYVRALAHAVYNGLALAPTYHRAFDNGLIYITEDYRMRINPAKEGELHALNLSDGIEGFKAPLGAIFLPPDKRQRPRPELIRKANRFRMIAG